MKKALKRTILLALSLALVLTQAAFAAPSEKLQAVYDALMAEGSSFNTTKATYAQYYQGVELDAKLEDDRIVITQSSTNEYVPSGSWTFIQEGDDLTVTFPQDDLSGIGIVMNLFGAVTASRGVNTSLLNGYMFALGDENPYMAMERDEKAGTVKYLIRLNAEYNFEGLDQMIMTKEKMDFLDPKDDTMTSWGGNYGKVIMVMNRNGRSLTILVCEHGGLDNVAYQDIINAVSAVQPEGWETFVAEYKELKDVKTDGYSVTLNPDDAQVGEIIDERYEGYSYAIVRIGKGE